MKRVLLDNITHPLSTPVRIDYCDSFWCRLRGLMFRPSLDPHEGLLMVQPTENRIDAAIHMLFMNFDITVVWIDHDWRVVDVQLARRWRPVYTPKKAAKYVLEIHPDRLNDFHPNDQLAMRK